MNLSTPVLQPSKIFEPIPDSPNEYKFRIDNSTLETIQACARAGFFYVVERRTTPGSPALDLGTACHFIEHFYRDGFTNETLSMVLQKIHTWYSLPTTLTDERRTESTANDIVSQYFNEHKTKEYLTPIPDPTTGSPMVEIPFEISLGTIDFNDVLPVSHTKATGKLSDDKVFISKLHIYWIGRIDVAVLYQGSPWVLDHKTASRLGDTFWAKFKTSSQMKGYTWSLSKILKTPVSGAIINVLAVPGGPRKKVEFFRQPFFYSTAELDEWLTDTMASICDFFSSFHRNHFPASPCNCLRWYGLCPYFSVCELQPQYRLNYLHSNEFAPVTWDPTSER